MMDGTSQKLLQLLRPDHPAELRCAAALVLGEVGAKEDKLADSLCQFIDDPETSFRLHVLTAIGKLRIERALPQLLAHIQDAGVEAEVAAQAAARLGAKGIRAVQARMAEASPGLRRRLAAALAEAGTASAETAAVDALLDDDAGVIDAAVRTLSSEVPALSAAQRRSLVDRLLELLQTKKGARLPLASETALVRLLAAIGDPRGEPIFWARTDSNQPPELRAAVLQALGSLPPPADRNKLQRLFACAGDADFRVAAPALMILKSIPVNGRSWKDWLPLLDARDVAVRRFAIDKLADRDTPELAAALVRQVRHPDRGLREAALDSLAKLKHGQKALVEELLETATAEEAWSLARAQVTVARHAGKELLARLFTQACKYLEANDRRADPLLFLLREVNAPELRDQLAERAVALRKKKQYDKALIYLRLLGRDPACGEAIRFESAACGLKSSTRDLAAEVRAADPCLQQFARLVHSHDTDPAVYVKQAKWLEPEDLFYLGFHFVEGNGPEKDFGAQVLKLLLERSPKSKLAKDAKSKLRSQAVD
jgi:HEAT repeat protein